MQCELLDGEDVFVIRDLLSQEECERLIEQAEAIGLETFTVDGELVVGYRTNARAFLESAELAESLWERVREFVPAVIDGQPACGLSPRFRFYRYRGSEAFAPHHDDCVSVGEPVSKLTIMIYLNDVARGGETRFYGPRLAVRFGVQPERGKALAFNHVILHEGVAVEDGCKYVLRSDVMYG